MEDLVYAMSVDKTREPTGIAAILKKACAGERLSRADGLQLLSSNDSIALGAAAQAVKKRCNGEQVYFNVNCHLNLTNICVALEIRHCGVRKSTPHSS